MSQVRHRTIRSRINTKTRKETSCEEKLRAVRALYIVVYNGEESLIPAATELFHALGDILEGTPMEQVEFRRVSKQRVLDAYAELDNK